jgi:hypothetical protein
VNAGVALFDTNFAALEFAAIILRQWTGRNPLFAYKRGEATRQRVRRLIRKNKIAAAIDAWMAGKPNPTIAIHKLRVLQKESNRVEAGDKSPTRCCVVAFRQSNKKHWRLGGESNLV